jgi:hypothetical protein
MSHIIRARRQQLELGFVLACVAAPSVRPALRRGLELRAPSRELYA